MQHNMEEGIKHGEAQAFIGGKRTEERKSFDELQSVRR